MSFDANVLNGFKQPEQSTSGIANDNQLAIYGTIDMNGTSISAAKLLNIASSNDAYSVSAAGALATSGKVAVVGGTGFALTLAAPTDGCFLDIWLASITSGSVTVKTATGVTFDGTNNTATFDAAADELRICYKSATQWQIVYNNSVTFSST